MTLRTIQGLGLGLALGGALALGCNNPTRPPDDVDMVAMADLHSPNDLAAPGDMASAYPPGPYGFEVGSVVAPLVWEGYANPTAEGAAQDKPYGRYTLDEIRRSGARYLLLYTADEF